MEYVTYNLKNEIGSSDEFYNRLAEFTDMILPGLREKFSGTVKNFMEFIETNFEEKPATDEEYLFDLLVLGSLWRLYSHHAMSVKPLPKYYLQAMALLREADGPIKDFADRRRAGSLAAHLYRDGRRASGYTLKVFSKLLGWLRATAEYKQEVKRLKKWCIFFNINENINSSDVLCDAVMASLEFEKLSMEYLGQYTYKVESFLHNELPAYKDREDYVSCRKSRLEYHLNMAGSEIMNRAFREDFLNSDEKVVLAPGCMRYHDNDKCRAEWTELGGICRGCKKGCNIRTLKETGREQGFKVYILKHSSDYSRWASGPGHEKVTGVVGIACVSTLLSGGWALKSYWIPAQCVFLDGAGCKKHWHKTGLTTGINDNKLNEIMDLAEILKETDR